MRTSQSPGRQGNMRMRRNHSRSPGGGMNHVIHNLDDSLDTKKKSERQGHCPHHDVVGGMTSIKSSSSSMTMTEVACYMIASLIIFVVCYYSGAIIGTTYYLPGTISSSSIANDIINSRPWKAGSGSNRPHFIIHIGPHKTGTTFLQSTLSVESADAILESDNYYYLGTTLSAFFREDKLAFPVTSIFTRSPFEKKDPKAKVAPLPTLNDDFLGVLQQMQDKQQSGIMVHEAIHKLPKEYVQALGERLNANWDVIVVEGYRPLHDWLVSRFNQFVRDEYESWIWPDGSAGPSIVRGMTDDDCYDCIGLPPNLRFGLTTNSDFDNKFVKPYIHRNTSIFEKSLDVWKMYFTDVRVVDMLDLPSRDDGQDPYLMHFTCDIVIGASNLCKGATELSKLTDTDMVSSEFGRAYELLTTWSWQLDLVDHTKHERRQIRREIERYHIDTFAKLNNNSTALPYICPPDSEIDMLWEWTLSTDKRIFATTYHRDYYSSSKREKALQVSFEKSAHGNKFCAVDITILLSEEWKPLFVYLDKVALGEVGYRVVADTTLDNYL